MVVDVAWPIVATSLESVKQDNKEPRDTTLASFDHWATSPTAPQRQDFPPASTSYDEDIALGRRSTSPSLDSQVDECFPHDESPVIRLDDPCSPNYTSGLSTTPHGNYPFETIDPPSKSPPASREAIKENPEPFIFDIFPSPSQAHYRDCLRREVISSRWWLESTLEPDGVVMQFMRRLNNRLVECTSCGKKLSIPAPVLRRIVQSAKEHASGAALKLKEKTCLGISSPESAVKPGMRRSVEYSSFECQEEL
ncbi:hypothetical protein FRC15_005044 [Serendipita sp. 397]|nr:hypothetical protein FRC15_005044 [Serendipita sp. 397]